MSSEYIGDIPTAFFRLSTSLLYIHYCHTVKKVNFYYYNSLYFY